METSRANARRTRPSAPMDSVHNRDGMRSRDWARRIGRCSRDWRSRQERRRARSKLGDRSSISRQWVVNRRGRPRGDSTRIGGDSSAFVVAKAGTDESRSPTSILLRMPVLAARLVPVTFSFRPRACLRPCRLLLVLCPSCCCCILPFWLELRRDVCAAGSELAGADLCASS